MVRLPDCVWVVRWPDCVWVVRLLGCDWVVRLPGCVWVVRLPVLCLGVFLHFFLYLRMYQLQLRIHKQAPKRKQGNNRGTIFEAQVQVRGKKEDRKKARKEETTT